MRAPIDKGSGESSFKKERVVRVPIDKKSGESFWIRRVKSVPG